jgi:hypothetical protein
MQKKGYTIPIKAGYNGQFWLLEVKTEALRLDRVVGGQATTVVHKKMSLQQSFRLGLNRIYF